jgi:hypothetical protein
VGILADKQIEWYDMKTILWIALSGKSPKGQSKMDYHKKLAALGTQDTGRRQKQKQTQIQ